MTLLLLLFACGSKEMPATAGANGLTGGPGGADDSETHFTIEDAELELSDAGAFLPAGLQPVHGIARAMDSVQIDGASVAVQGGNFAHELDLALGITPVDLTGTDVEGGDHRDFSAVLAGDYAAADGPVHDAIQMQLSQQALDDLTVIAGSFIEPDLLNPTLQGLNPIVDTPDAIVTLGTLTFGTPEMYLTPTDQGLEMQLILTDFVLPIDATIPDALPFGIDLDLSADVEADAVILYATVDLSTNGNGKLQVDLRNVEAELQGFDLDTGLLEIVDWLVLDDDDLADFLEGQVSAVGPALGGAMNDLVQGLDLKTELDLFGSPLVIWPAFDDADVDADGVYLSMAVAVDVEGGSKPVPGHLHVPAPAARVGSNALMQVGDDLMNRALFEVWQSGALDIELPLDTPETGTILALFGGSGEGSMALDLGLPPVWVEKGGKSRLQLGDTLMTVATPDGKYGDEVQFHMFFDAAASIQLKTDSAAIVLSDPQVKLVPAGEGADDEEIAELAEGLQSAFSIAIGIINGMLEFPLTDLLGPDAQLPELAMERDPSGTGVAADLDLSSIDILALFEGVTGGSTTTTP